MATKTAKTKTPPPGDDFTETKLSAFRLPGETRKQLQELADALQGGNQAATLREIIRTAHRKEFGR
jgi:hypothetical protein